MMMQVINHVRKYRNVYKNTYKRSTETMVPYIEACFAQVDPLCVDISAQSGHHATTIVQLALDNVNKGCLFSKKAFAADGNCVAPLATST